MSHQHQKLIIITAPSGAGKTSITRYLLNHIDKLAFSVSAATRPRRDYEVDGRDYYFMTVEEFQQKIKQKEFMEWEMVYEGKYYGTLKSEVQRLWKDGKVPVLDIDVKGAIHVQSQYPEQTLSIFIEPPSVEELKKRLTTRGTESAETLETRVNKAAFEISFKHHFDRIVVNDDLDKACQTVEQIVLEFLNQ